MSLENNKTQQRWGRETDDTLTRMRSMQEGPGQADAVTLEKFPHHDVAVPCAADMLELEWDR